MSQKALFVLLMGGWLLVIWKCFHLCWVWLVIHGIFFCAVGCVWVRCRVVRVEVVVDWVCLVVCGSGWDIFSLLFLVSSNRLHWSFYCLNKIRVYGWRLVVINKGSLEVTLGWIFFVRIRKFLGRVVWRAGSSRSWSRWRWWKKLDSPFCRNRCLRNRFGRDRFPEVLPSVLELMYFLQ